MDGTASPTPPLYGEVLILNETVSGDKVFTNTWRRKWQPTPVLLPGKFQGQRSLVGYSPWGCKESDMTDRLH